MDSDEIEKRTQILTRKKAIWCIMEIGNNPGKSKAEIIGYGDERTKYLAIEDLITAGMAEYDPTGRKLQLTRHGRLVKEQLDKITLMMD